MSVDIDKAKKALKDLKAKIDLVEEEDRQKNPQSVRDYWTCKEEYNFLNGVLQNKAYEWILNKLKNNESDFNVGIKDLTKKIQIVNDGSAFLGIVDRVVEILIKITPFFR